MSRGRWRGGQYQGQLYALPLTLTGNMLFYRRDLLDAAGMTPPRSLAELGRQAAVLARGEGMIGGLGLHGIYLHNDVFPMLWASGGDVVGPDGEARLVSASNARVLELLAGWVGEGPGAIVPRGVFAGAWREAYRAPLHTFVRGELPFLITWSSRWDLFQAADSMVKGKVGAVPLPGLEVGSASSNLGSWYMGVSAFSRHPREAATFVRYMLTPEVQRYRLEQLGFLPARRDVLEDPEVLARHPQIAALRPALELVRPRPRVPNEAEVDGLIEGHLRSAVLGDVTPEEALAAAAAAVDAVRIPARVAELAIVLPEPAAPVGGLTRRVVLTTCAGVLVLLLLTALALGFVHRRRPLRLLSMLSAKMALVGAATTVALMVTAGGLMTSHALDTQERELAESRAFYTAQMTSHGRTLGKQVALAASLLAEQEAAADDLNPMSLLMMASHFTEELLSLELLDLQGAPLHTDRDLMRSDKPGLAPRSADIAARIQRRSIAVAERVGGDGTASLEVLVPVFRSGVHMGAVRLLVSQAAYRARLAATRARHEREMRRLIDISLMTTLLLVLVGVVLVGVLARKLTRPIVALTRNAERVREGDLDVEFPPGPVDEIGTLSSTMAEMVQGLRDRDFIRDVFGRFVNDDLAARLLEDPDSLALGGQRVELTVMMTDLRGFTSLSAELGPERMVSLLNRYLGRMTDVIMARGGTINDFIGDAILVLFGAPIPWEDHAERAAACALEMQLAMLEFNEESRALGVPPLEMGVGLNTGVVIAGNIGSRQRMKYGVVGSTVNEAALVEGFTVGFQVLMSQATRDALGDAVEVGEPMSVKAKGRSEPLVIYELLGTAGEEALRAPDRTAGGSVEVEVEASWVRLEGKDASGTTRTDTITRLGRGFALLQASSALRPLDDVKLQATLEAGHQTRDMYAKVVAVRREAPEVWVTELRFTSMEDADRQVIEAMVGETA